MKLQDLFSVFPEVPESSFSQMDVAGVTQDARQVQPGFIFVAIKGHQRDGHQFIADAIAKGAMGVVVMDRTAVPSNFDGFILHHRDTRQALDLLASRFYHDPGRSLFCIGVTGTNGKTSVTYMVEWILNQHQMPTGVIGTVNHHLGQKVWPTEMTTPDPVFLQKRLLEFKEAGAKAVAMEVSSHALDQMRVASVPFNCVIFTNLSRDHLDYHKTMQEYFLAKERLFTDLIWRTSKSPSFAVVNVDDSYGRRLRIAEPAVLWTYGRRHADFCYQIKKVTFAQTEVAVNSMIGDFAFTLPMAGEHNVQNAMAAVIAAMSAGVPLEVGLKALESFPGVPGRLQAVQHQGKKTVLVDYAHSPDALKNVLLALRKVREQAKSSGKIWVIFGCGGDRDKGKRPQMAQVACELADHICITSDNPRTEDPQQIVQDIIAGVPAEAMNRVQSIVDRTLAIEQTLKDADDSDVVLIAGKGHEDYQIIGTQKIAFSDFAVAQKVLGEL